MGNKHTPGPWKVSIGENESAIYTVMKDKHGFHETVLPPTRDVSRGNLTLIAAAPELYALVKTIPLLISANLTTTQRNEITASCVAAICKAEGRENS